jgi:hypothetical protein
MRATIRETERKNTVGLNRRATMIQFACAARRRGTMTPPEDTEMKCYHSSPECSVFAIGDADTFDTGIEDTVVDVFKNGAPCGRIICRFDEWQNELTYHPSAGLPVWIVGFYVGDDYPDSALSEGYTFK